MARQGVKGKVVLVSSVLGLISFFGYSQYSPTKYAIKGILIFDIKVRFFKFFTHYLIFLLGLAETLRNELFLYGIDVHCYFAGTIDSPGLQQEVNLI